MALRDEPDHICFASAALWDSQTFTTCSLLTSTSNSPFFSAVRQRHFTRRTHHLLVCFERHYARSCSPDVIFKPPCDVCSSQQLPPLHPLCELEPRLECLTRVIRCVQQTLQLLASTTPIPSSESRTEPLVPVMFTFTQEQLCGLVLQPWLPCPRQLSLAPFPSAMTRDL